MEHKRIQKIPKEDLKEILQVECDLPVEDFELERANKKRLVVVYDHLGDHHSVSLMWDDMKQMILKYWQRDGEWLEEWHISSFCEELTLTFSRESGAIVRTKDTSECVKKTRACCTGWSAWAAVLGAGVLVTKISIFRPEFLVGSLLMFLSVAVGFLVRLLMYRGNK